VDETVQGKSDLVLVGKHDRENARRLFGVGGVFGPEHHFAVVVVDLPEELLACYFEAPEVVFSMRVIIRGEVRELLYLD
jgi:hypothetical protein